MPIFTYDSSVFVAKKTDILPKRGYVLSSVVIQEMVAGAPDSSHVERWKQLHAGLAKEDRVVFPNRDEWLEAGTIIYRMLHVEASQRRGQRPRLSPNQKYRILSDVLIALCARRARAQLVTDNLADFKRIQKHCGVKLIGLKDYSGSSKS
jgi:predicted nucleic acid-binding protein